MSGTLAWLRGFRPDEIPRGIHDAGLGTSERKSDLVQEPRGMTRVPPAAGTRLLFAKLPDISAYRARRMVSSSARSSPSASVKTNEEVARTTVVCIHGFLGSRFQFLPIAGQLRRNGFRVMTYSYRSRSKTAVQHAEELVDVLRERAGLREGDPPDRDGQRPISFVTHSFGGVVLRCALAHPKCPTSAQTGRAVLVAPPLRGSKLARTLAKYPYLGGLTRLTLGNQSGADFTDREADDFESMGDVEFPRKAEYLLVVGDVGRINPALTDSSDGILSTHDSKLRQPHRRLVVRGTHNVLLLAPQVINAVARFLRGDQTVGSEESGSP